MAVFFDNIEGPLEMEKMAKHEVGNDNVDTQDVAKSSRAQALFVHLLCACFMFDFLYSLVLVQKSQLHSACHAIRPERSALHNKDCILHYRSI